MLSLMMAVVMLSWVEPSESTSTRKRNNILGKLGEVESLAQQLQFNMTDRYVQSSAIPLTGISVDSDPERGPDGFHALTVTQVVIDEPADKAGVRVGDRILFIGSRRIEHESAEVADLFLHNGPGSLILTIRRENQDLLLVVHRTGLACMQRATQSLDTAKWQARNTNLLGELQLLRQKLLESSSDGALMVGIQTLHELEERLRAITNEVNDELDQAGARECRARPK